MFRICSQNDFDRPMSGISRPSAVNNFVKHLLLNHLANLVETWLGCSLDEALKEVIKEITGCIKKEKNAKSLKIFSSVTIHPHYIITIASIVQI